MDEPGWSWPAWKFGMKRGDLFTKLHDQYNTMTTPIQDNEAFHHDVYEISNFARCTDEFHRMMAQRKEQRLAELNNGLELASVKIISNPNLIGTDQWAFAIQLFRARSLDALVRYFSSYLPESQYESDAETLDSHSIHSDLSRSSTASISTANTDVSSEAPPAAFFPEKGATTHEPLRITTSLPPQEPLSPPSSEEDADSPAASPTDLESQDGDSFPVNGAPSPASRSMSFSGSESGRLPPYHHARDADSMNEESADEDDYDTPSTHHHDDPAEIEPDLSQPANNDFDIACHPDTAAAAVVSTPQPCCDVESDAPTPRPQITDSTSYISAVKIAARIRRSPSPSPRTRLAQAEARKSCSLSPRMRKRELSPQVSRTPCEMLSRIQKPLSDHMRPRNRGRRRIEVE